MQQRHYDGEDLFSPAALLLHKGHKAPAVSDAGSAFSEGVVVERAGSSDAWEDYKGEAIPLSLFDVLVKMTSRSKTNQRKVRILRIPD